MRYRNTQIKKLARLYKFIEALAPRLLYHNLNHLKDVAKIAKKYALLEGLNSQDVFILETAGLLHDIVYKPNENDNEEKSVEASKNILLKAGYSLEEIEKVSKLILATKIPRNPKNILEMIISDADFDYLGREDFWERTELLRLEMELDKEKWYSEIEPDFLNKIKYYTGPARTQRKAKLDENLKRLEKNKATNNKILVAGWSLTKMCNLKCIHCYAASGKRTEDELFLKEAIKVADKLKQAGTAAINFGGGECCLRNDFIQLCRYLKKLGLKISYTTNGTTFRFIEPHLNLFHDIGVSIDFGEAKKHDWFRGAPGTFDKAISTIKKLVAKGVDTEMVTCLTKLNCSKKELRKLYNLAKSLGVDYWRLNRFRTSGRGKDSKSYLALSKNDLKNAYRFLANYVDNSVSVPDPLFRAAFGGKYFIEGDPSGFTTFRIQPNGKVTPSVFLDISGGNIKEKSLHEIMDSNIFRMIRNRNPKGKCLKCPSYSHCRGGDAGASFLEYGHFNGPDPLCWLNLNKKRAVPVKYAPQKWNVHELYLCTVYVPINQTKKIK